MPTTRKKLIIFAEHNFDVTKLLAKPKLAYRPPLRQAFAVRYCCCHHCRCCHGCRIRCSTDDLNAFDPPLSSEFRALQVLTWRVVTTAAGGMR